jgi:hypothetical protein
VVDERTGKKSMVFYETKAGMIEPTCAQLHFWKTSGHGAKYIPMDHAGENIVLHDRSDSSNWKVGIKFEYTARNTPRQNHLAELGFAHIAKLSIALTNHVNVPLKRRFKLFTKAFKTATLLLVIELDGVSDTRFKHWCGTNGSNDSDIISIMIALIRNKNKNKCWRKKQEDPNSVMS